MSRTDPSRCSRRRWRSLPISKTIISIATTSCPALVRAFDAFLGKAAGQRRCDRRRRQSALGVAGAEWAPRQDRHVRHRPAADLRAENLSSTGRSRASMPSPATNSETVELRVPGRDQRAERAGRDRGRARTRYSIRALSPRLSTHFAACAAASIFLRRSERLVVVDDYAHHPTAVRATIAAARSIPSRGRSSSPFSRTAIPAPPSWRASSPTRCAARIASTSRRSTRRRSRPFRGERTLDRRAARADGRACEYVARVEELADRVFDEAPHGAMVLMLGAGNITDVPPARRQLGQWMSATTAQRTAQLARRARSRDLADHLRRARAFDAPLARIRRGRSADRPMRSCWRRTKPNSRR